jgi:hypothetical protein
VDIPDRVRRLERQLKAVTALWLLTLAAVVFVAAQPQAAAPPDKLRVRQITVVDDKGTERVWIGAPLPDPIVEGRRRTRSGPISGIVLLDAKGNERTGYATSDGSGEVFLGLDSEKEQQTLFLVNPGGGGHLSVFDKDGNLARLGILDGRPFVQLRQKKEIVFEQPPPPKE